MKNKFNTFYILDGKRLKVAKDALEWAYFFEDANNRIVANDQLQSGIEVSTIFLGIDSNLGQSGFPLLFETMVFGGPMDGHRRRHTVYLEAENYHKKIVKEIKDKLASEK
jgi:hypothetical protein